MNLITPVILAGGSGTRLWPVSRNKFPKQFSSFVGENTLLQDCALRLTSSEKLKFNSPLTVTNVDFRFLVGEQLQNVGIDPGPILIEPSARNTAPAVLAATLYECERNKDAVLLVAPSDHLIPDVEAFQDAVMAGLNEVEKGNLVTFGITPTGPETGYGYLKIADKLDGDAFKVEAFVEKPDLTTAQEMIASGSYSWNAGIFLFRAKDMLAAFEEYCSELIVPVQKSLDGGEVDLGFFRLNEDAWSECKSISIDHAIMEKVSNLSAVPYSARWSDLGSWGAVGKELKEDENGVVLSSSATAIDCKDVFLRSHSADQQIVGLGLKNIIAVAMPDAVLVMDSSKTQEVGNVVQVLKDKSIVQAEEFPWEHRPWGRFEVLSTHEGCKVKRIIVKPGGILSLQKHFFRSEHWVVVEGVAKVTIDGQIKSVKAGESVYVPQGIVHRMENAGDAPMVLIEVQTGTYLGEDDIARLEDHYSRN